MTDAIDSGRSRMAGIG